MDHICPSSSTFAFEVDLLSSRPLVDHIDAENACAFISRDAINKLKCVSGDWLRVYISDLKLKCKSKKRFCQIYEHDLATNDKTAYISPQLWFNFRDTSSHSTNRPFTHSNVQLMIKRDKPKAQQLCYATAVHVSLVHSPNYCENDDYSLVLKSYFKKCRFVMKGDIIGISSRDDVLYLSHDKDLSKVDWPVIYFRVTLIEGNGNLIDVNNSKLYQTGTVHSLIPVTLSTYYGVSATLPPLSKYVNLLCDLVYPYLTTKDRMLGTILMNGHSGSGRKTIVSTLCRIWNLHLIEINTNDLLGDTASATEAKIKIAFSKVSIYAPCVVLIRRIDLICKHDLFSDPRISTAFKQSFNELMKNFMDWPIIVVATNTDSRVSVANDLLSLFVHQIDIECPNFEERKSIMKSLIGDIPLSPDVNLSELALKTAGFYFSDLCSLVSKAISSLYSYTLDYNSVDILSHHYKDIPHSKLVLTHDFLVNSLNALQRQHADAIGSPNMPNVQWSDIGGLDPIKREIVETIQIPLDYPILLKSGFKRSGILLYGPPGTGKTLLAKAAATQCSLNFLSVKGPELINMYVGQSEQNIRDIFSRARRAAPCIIFFDEIDSLAPRRGRSGDSGGLMDRVVSQLLSEMDGINKSNDVFIIGTTNRPDLLDSALLRPGRFDRLIPVNIADDSLSRLKILTVLTKKFLLASDIDLEIIESKCPKGLSGADFYSLCSNALMNAIARNIHDIECKMITEENCEIKVELTDFTSALPEIISHTSQ